MRTVSMTLPDGTVVQGDFLELSLSWIRTACEYYNKNRTSLEDDGDGADLSIYAHGPFAGRTREDIRLVVNDWLERNNKWPLVGLQFVYLGDNNDEAD